MTEPVLLEAESIPVKVVIRVRPLIPLELGLGATECVTVDEKTNTVFINERSFSFDSVFGSKCTQDFVYEDSVRDLLLSSFNGYNTTIFAYGQTGSGKTYTMGTGFDNDVEEEQRGILPRMINDIFDKLNADVEQCASEGVSYEVYASFAEIYNEKVYDLLNHRNERLSIINNGDDVIVKGLSERRVSDNELCYSQVYRVDDMMRILYEGSEGRSVGSTEMNKQSSRSHAIFTITICKVSEEVGVLRGKINFVDLAGSERLDKTKATGSRAQEGISINKSLSTLSKVIEALVTHQTHIPYRESSLTRLLKDSLGGNAKTVMIACVSPADTNCSETVNTLRWADQARKIQNKPTVNMDPTTAEILKLKHRIVELEEIIARKDSQQPSCETPSKQHQNQMLLEKEVERLRESLLRTQSLYEQTKRDLDYFLSQRNEQGFEALLQEKNEEIERLKMQSIVSLETLTLPSEMMEEEEIDLDEEEQEQLETLTQEEEKISTLLESKKQIQTLKERYEAKLFQITTQMDMLTKENGTLHQQLTEAEKKTALSAVKTVQDLKKKLKKNEMTIQQLQKWKEEYDRMIKRYREKESEVHDLQNSLKQVRGEKIRFQKEMAKKAREAELQRRRKELEDSKRRKKDRKEQEALEKQIKQLEIKLSREKEKKEKQRSPIIEKKVSSPSGLLTKQVNGIIRREVSEQALTTEYNELIAKRQQLQQLIDSKQKELVKQKGKKIAKLIEDRLQTYQQEKSVLTAKISRLNKKMSIAAAPTGVSRWVQFSTFDQLHGTCDVLLSELLKQTQKNSDLSKENKRLKGDADDLLSQLKEEERKTAFLLSRLSIDTPGELDSFLKTQLELYQDQKQLLEIELDEEKTINGIKKTLVNSRLSDEPSVSLLKPDRLHQQKRELDDDVKNSPFHTPPRVSRPSLSLGDYSKLEKGKYFFYKSNASSFQENESQKVSIDDLSLPKIDSIEQSVLDYKAKSGSMTEEEKKLFAKQQEEEINLILSSSCCNCKGKCTNRKCPCRNYGRRCSADCKCSPNQCVNRDNATNTEMDDDTVIESN